jgi:DNA-binding NarL/FixJ family response regulator
MNELSNEVLLLHRPEIILWDLGWEGSLEAKPDQENWINHMTEVVNSDVPVLALVSEPHQAIEAWTTGAVGILARTFEPQEFVAAIHAIQQGLTVVKGNLGKYILPEVTSMDHFPSDPLSDREVEVLQLLAEGISNKAIALQLNLSEHTIKFHVNTIFRKLRVQSRTEAVVQAYRLGLIII